MLAPRPGSAEKAEQETVRTFKPAS
jgi:hypothetical protein